MLVAILIRGRNQGELHEITFVGRNLGELMQHYSLLRESACKTLAIKESEPYVICHPIFLAISYYSSFIFPSSNKFILILFPHIRFS